MLPKTILLSALLFIACGAVSAKGAITGTWEGVIQDPARPLVVNVDLDQQILKLDATGSTTWKIDTVTVEDLTIKFTAVVGDRQFEFTGHIDKDRIDGEMKTPDRLLPFWLERLPVLAQPQSPIDAWNQDLDVVIGRFLTYDRSYSDAAREQVRERVARLRTQLAKLSDDEIIVELSRIVALSGNAHTRLYIVRNRTEVRRLPVRVWWFKNELRVVRAMEDYRYLLGCRITKVGDLSVLQAAMRVRGIKAGNDSWQRYMSTYMLTSSDILFGAHVIPSAERVSVSAVCNGQTKRARLVSLPMVRDNNAVEAWWDLTPESRAQNAAFLPSISSKKAPLYLRRTKENYWFEYLPKENLIFFQYNRAQNASTGPPMSDFGQLLIASVREKKPVGLVVDLRFNTGGDLTVGKPLMKKIADEIGPVPVFVITGRATFSAGITHVVELKQWAHATIVGEPAGDGLEMWSEGGNLLMPNSKLTLHYGNAFHRYSNREFPERRPYVEEMNVDSIAPDIPVEQTWNDYINGRDPALDAIIRRLRQHKVSP